MLQQVNVEARRAEAVAMLRALASELKESGAISDYHDYVKELGQKPQAVHAFYDVRGTGSPLLTLHIAVDLTQLYTDDRMFATARVMFRDKLEDIQGIQNPDRRIPVGSEDDAEKAVLFKKEPIVNTGKVFADAMELNRLIRKSAGEKGIELPFGPTGTPAIA